MEITKLKQIVNDFSNGKTNENNSYVSLLAIEQVLKKKYDEFALKVNEFSEHISNLLGTNCTVNCTPEEISVVYVRNVITGEKSSIRLRVWQHDNTITVHEPIGVKIKSSWKNLLYADEETKAFVKSLNALAEKNKSFY